MKKIFQSRSWYHPSAETKKKMSLIKLGHEVSEETRRKIREATIGQSRYSMMGKVPKLNIVFI